MNNLKKFLIVSMLFSLCSCTTKEAEHASISFHSIDIEEVKSEMDEWYLDDFEEYMENEDTISNYFIETEIPDEYQEDGIYTIIKAYVYQNGWQLELVEDSINFDNSKENIMKYIGVSLNRSSCSDSESEYAIYMCGSQSSSYDLSTENIVVPNNLKNRLEIASDNATVELDEEKVFYAVVYEKDDTNEITTDNILDNTNLEYGIAFTVTFSLDNDIDYEYGSINYMDACVDFNYDTDLAITPTRDYGEVVSKYGEEITTLDALINDDDRDQFSVVEINIPEEYYDNVYPLIKTYVYQDGWKLADFYYCNQNDEDDYTITKLIGAMTYNSVCGSLSSYAMYYAGIPESYNTNGIAQEGAVQNEDVILEPFQLDNFEVIELDEAESLLIDEEKVFFAQVYSENNLKNVDVNNVLEQDDLQYGMAFSITFASTKNTSDIKLDEIEFDEGIACTKRLEQAGD